MEYKVYYKQYKLDDWTLAYDDGYTELQSEIIAIGCKQKIPLMHWGFGTCIHRIIEVK